MTHEEAEPAPGPGKEGPVKFSQYRAWEKEEPGKGRAGPYADLPKG